MVAAVALLVWAVSYPWLAALALATLALAALGVSAVGPHAARLVRCVSECQRLTLSLGRYGHITVSRTQCCPSG